MNLATSRVGAGLLLIGALLLAAVPVRADVFDFIPPEGRMLLPRALAGIPSPATPSWGRVLQRGITRGRESQYHQRWT